MPYIVVTNLAHVRDLKAAASGGFGHRRRAWARSDAKLEGPLGVVLGAEGGGCNLTGETCDSLVSIPMNGTVRA